MPKHTLPDWSARLGITSTVPLVAAAVAAAPTLEAHAGDTVTKGSGALMVVINHEEQYSLWPASNAVPKGWKAVTEEAPATTAAATLKTYVGGEEVYVVINHEEQYSVWLKGEPLPDGWEATGQKCAAAACGNLLERLGGTTK